MELTSKNGAHSAILLAFALCAMNGLMNCSARICMI